VYDGTSPYNISGWQVFAENGAIKGGVTISGTTAPGSTLSAVYTNPDDAPIIYYRWYRDTALLSTTAAAYELMFWDIGYTITVRVYAEGYTGYVPATSAAITDTVTPLTVDAAYTAGAISAASEVHWYSFPAASGTFYFMRWDETGGSGSYTGNIRVSAYQADGTTLFTTIDSGYTAPQTIMGDYTGTVYLRVSGSAPGSYAVKVDTGIPLTVGSGSGSAWTTGTMSAGSQIDWYSFTASSGDTYTVQWDDSYLGTSTYSADIRVTAYRADGTAFFTNIDNGYTTPQTITGYDGTVYLRVTPYSSSSALGDYAVRVYE
jgi:hypothetical protein